MHVPDLATTQANVQIEFLSAGSNFRSLARYQYRAAGSDEWSEPSADSTVTFASFPAGSFRFEVRAINERGVASTSPAFIEFNILRPVWQRWWFLLLIAVAVSVLVYFVYRYRLGQAIKVERIRTRITSDLHDDLKNIYGKLQVHSKSEAVAKALKNRLV